MIRACHWSSPGGHVENQDAFIVGNFWCNPEWWVGAVSDGQGGQTGAAEAAQCACRTFLQQVESMAAKHLASPTNWLSWLQVVDEAVRQDSVAGYCALVALAVSETSVIGASCGDCAALAYGAGQEPKVLTSRQRKNPPVGSGAADFTPFAFSLVSPWTVLLCSDGVWKYTGWDLLTSLDPQQPGEVIIEALRRRAVLPRTGDLQDDFTLVVMQQLG